MTVTVTTWPTWRAKHNARRSRAGRAASWIPGHGGSGGGLLRLGMAVAACCSWRWRRRRWRCGAVAAALSLCRWRRRSRAVLSRALAVPVARHGMLVPVLGAILWSVVVAWFVFMSAAFTAWITAVITVCITASG